MSISTPQSDTPGGWDRYSRLLHDIDKRPLPPGYHERFQSKLSAIGTKSWRFAKSFEFIGGASLAVFAAVIVLSINSAMPSMPVAVSTVTQGTKGKTTTTHTVRQRRQRYVRPTPSAPTLTTPIYTDTMPPSTLDQDYQNPAVTGGNGPSEDQMQHDAQPGVPAMTR